MSKYQISLVAIGALNVLALFHLLGLKSTYLQRTATLMSQPLSIVLLVGYITAIFLVFNSLSMIVQSFKQTNEDSVQHVLFSTGRWSLVTLVIAFVVS